MAGPVAAYDASVGWEPTSGAAGYKLFVRYEDDGVALPTDVGSPVADADGLVRVFVESLPLGPTAYFAVAAYDASGRESAQSAELAITYAQAAAVSDSDGDGLTDAEEDADLDGIADAGETDRLRADTDGDGFDDASELGVYGTDPLDASSNPSCTDPTRCGGDGGDDGSDTVESVWVVAAFDPTAERWGAMTSDDTYAGGDDEDPLADSLASELIFPLSTSNSLTGGSGDRIKYRVSLPASGQWYLWGRFYWPGAPDSNDANSFFARVDGGSPLTFGNNKDHYRRWHWGGDGATERGVPQALALGYLGEGEHTLAIEKRESVPIPPRLDVLVLTRSPTWQPTDEAALTTVGDLLSGTTTTTVSTTTTTTTTTSSTTTSTTETTTTTDTTTSTTTTTTTVTLPPPPPPPPPVPPSTTTTVPLATTTTTLPAECSNADDCLDADPCTSDECVAGECVHAASSGGACDDGDPCTVGDVCGAGTCGGWPLDCSHLDGACSYGVCDPQTAECVAADLASGTSCDDGSGCTTGDTCDAGVCAGQPACPQGSFCHHRTGTCLAQRKVWIAAARDDTATFAGAMTKDATYTAGDDADAAADSLETELVFADSAQDDTRGRSGDEVSYVVDLPESGEWFLWARLYAPGAPGSRDANSFFVRVDDGRMFKLGNNRNLLQTWHWGGDGRVRSGAPRPLPLRWLAAGTHTVTVAKREVTPLAPRLDVIVLTQDPTWIPTDDEALPALQ